jgi:hypothetical protein
MKLFPTGSEAKADTVNIAEPSPEPVPKPVPAPVLITEQQVLLGSAAAAGLRAAPAPRWWGVFSRAFARPARQRRREPRTYPARHQYLEDARMSREMYRL